MALFFQGKRVNESDAEALIKAVLTTKNPFIQVGTESKAVDEKHFISGEKIDDLLTNDEKKLLHTIVLEWISAPIPEDNIDEKSKHYSKIKSTQLKTYESYGDIACALYGCIKARQGNLVKEEKLAWGVIGSLEVYEKSILDPLIESIRQEIFSDKFSEDALKKILSTPKYHVYGDTARPVDNIKINWDNQRKKLNQAEPHLRLIEKLSFIDDYTRGRRMYLFGQPPDVLFKSVTTHDQKLIQIAISETKDKSPLELQNIGLLACLKHINIDLLNSPTILDYDLREIKKCILTSQYGEYRAYSSIKYRDKYNYNPWTLDEKNSYIKTARMNGIPLWSGPANTVAFLLSETKRIGITGQLQLMHLTWSMFAWFHIMPTVKSPTHTFHEVMMGASQFVDRFSNYTAKDYHTFMSLVCASMNVGILSDEISSNKTLLTVSSNKKLPNLLLSFAFLLCGSVLLLDDKNNYKIKTLGLLIIVAGIVEGANGIFGFNIGLVTNNLYNFFTRRSSGNQLMLSVVDKTVISTPNPSI